MQIEGETSEPPWVARYLANPRRGGIEGEHRQPHRGEAETVILDLLPERVDDALDLGCGDGRLLEVVLAARPGANGVGIDSLAAMVDAARKRLSSCAGETRAFVYDFSTPLWDAGFEPDSFDVIVSSFAVHHCEHDRKQELFREVHSMLRPNGVFANLDSIEQPEGVETRWLTERMETDRLASLDDNLAWMRAAGMTQVDCYWKWLDMVLMVGMKTP